MPNRKPDIPTSMEDVADLFGYGVALQLMQTYGGQDVEFPKKLRDGHEWFSIFGADVAHDLCHFLSGQRMYVPRGGARQTLQEIKALEKLGKKRHEMARLLRVSERHIRRLSNSDPPSTPLFPELDD
ncbi:hypothetical protein [Thalassovita sp.]|uniref:hypothetical protein n=1 Tax=Thalassovita sp. TaxID=1979401 RepID=UPI002B26E15A|nr:hypothetical protein [Thalassovita sp.]